MFSFKRLSTILFTALLTLVLILAQAPCAFATSYSGPWKSSTANPFWYKAYYDKSYYYTYKTLYHNSRFSGRNIYYGADISHWNNDRNGTMDYKKAKADGVDFVIIKVCGTSLNSKFYQFPDPCYKKNIKAALDAGLKVGVYYFSQAKSVSEAKSEARYILNLVKGYNIELPIVMDYEYADGRLTGSSPGKSTKTDCVEAFCETIKDGGFTPMLYANLNFLERSVYGKTLSKKYMVWVAHYNSRCGFDGNYQFWQYSDAGKISGFTGATDSNVWYATASEFKSNINSPFSVNTIADQNYTGSEIKPAVTVRDAAKDKTLKKGTDYTLSYSDNIYPGQAVITVKGMGDYSGKKRFVYFGIKGTLEQFTEPAGTSAGDGESQANKTKAYYYRGREVKPTAKLDNLVSGVDYTVSYSNNLNVGTATITYKGIGYCSGTVTENFRIIPRSIGDESCISAEISNTAYTGNDLETLIKKSLKVKMQVTYNDGKKEIKTLKQGTDYTVDSIDRETWDTVGSPNTVTTGYVTIRGIGNFKGSRSIEYRICPNISDSSAFNISINGKRAELTDSGLYLTYTGKALKPSMEIEQIGSSTVEAVEGEGNTTEKIYSYNPDTNRTLVEGTDYSVTYRSNIDAGDATVTATGKGELYGGSVSRTFHILPRDSKSVSGKPAYTKATYNGKSKTPSITCTYNGMTLSKGVDYKLSYESGRVKIGTYHIYVEYMGNYAGTKTLKFVINPKGTSVKKLAAGKRTVNVYWYKRSSENTSGYQIRYSRHSSMKDSHVRTVKGSRCYGKILKHLKSGTRYYVQVRVYKKTGGKTYYSDWSSKRSIKAK